MSVINLVESDNSNAAHWTARQCLEDFIEDIDNDRVAVDNMVIIFREKNKRIGWRCAGKSDPYEKIGMAQGFLYDYVKTIEGECD